MDKHTPDDGPPVSGFTLGERYGSQDMYRDFPDLRLGDTFAVERDGVVYTDTVQNVTYSSGSPEIRREIRWWERFIPARWRKPVVIRAAEPATVWVNSDEPPTGRTLAQLREMKRGLDGLLGL